MRETDFVYLRCSSAVILCMSMTIAGVARANDTSPEKADTSLRGRYPQFVVGVALGNRLPGDYVEEELALVRRHFGCVTPENCMKMSCLQPKEGHFNFAEADAVVDFAEKNGLAVCGHALVWARDEQTPAWMFQDGEKQADRQLVLDRMRRHIRTVVKRYKGRVAFWDVVNEAIDEGDLELRPSRWAKTTGLEFIEEAFRCAHECDPDAVLIYNDYHTESLKKQAKLLSLVKRLRTQGVPVHAIGIQGHWQLGRVPFDQIERHLEAIRVVGMRAVVSELDVSVVPRHRWWADGGKHRKELMTTDPYADGCPEDILVQQSDDYVQLFDIFVRHADVIQRVTFWNLHDGRSWLNSFPWKHADHPLLFDRECRPKPAFHALMRPSQENSSHPAR